MLTCALLFVVSCRKQRQFNCTCFFLFCSLSLLSLAFLCVCLCFVCVFRFIFGPSAPRCCCAATPANLLALRADLAEVALQIDAEEDLFVRKGVAIKYLRKALKKKGADVSRLRQAVDARDTDIRNLGDRMDSVHRLLVGVAVQ